MPKVVSSARHQYSSCEKAAAVFISSAVQAVQKWEDQYIYQSRLFDSIVHQVVACNEEVKGLKVSS